MNSWQRFSAVSSTASQRMPCAANSFRHQVRAKKPRSSERRSGSIRKAPPSFNATKRTTSGHLDFGDGLDEPAAAAAVLALLAQDFLGEVPRQQQHVIGYRFQQ